MLYHFTD